MLADQEVQLAESLKTDQDKDPRARPGFGPHAVGESDQLVVRHRGPDQDEPDQYQDEQELHPVPEPEGLAGRSVVIPGPLAGRTQSLGGECRGLTHHELLTVKDVITVFIWLSSLLKQLVSQWTMRMYTLVASAFRKAIWSKVSMLPSG